MPNQTEEIEVSPYYMRKLHTFFNCINQHKIEILTKKDYELQADCYQRLAQVSTLREQQARRKLLAIWDDYFEEVSKSTPITPEVFAKAVVQKGKEKLIQSFTHYADLMFDLIDLNADGKINPNEFILLHKVYLLNEETADAAFKSLDKENKGYVEYDSFVKAVIAYFQPEDETETVLWGPLTSDNYLEEVSKTTPITAEVFTKCIAHRGKEQIISTATHYADLIFDLIDVNADGKINPPEFVLFHKLYLLNEETADAAFKQLDKENKGYVEYDDFVKAVIAYFNPDDESETVLWGPLVD